ncbi:dihydroorotate dehydrogenase [Corallincola holothuriorum]|uniref:Dihydroorotate dehydrogenase n=2 Tax=Corallincola holothuriorum TaxID=2282215 RepID=A0A368NJE1_9GAMM|nr:dihydroorotate dehydrogenase [Corallincola holothuriorum]
MAEAAPMQFELYDISKTYEDNYQNGPFFAGDMPTRPAIKQMQKVFDFEVNSRLGVPAGPLLNSHWCDVYAQLGFDLPVYKTVRSVERACHPAPNCIFLNAENQFSHQDINTQMKPGVRPSLDEKITITNSFGVPSLSPEVWMKDIEAGNKKMGSGQLMLVSVNGTPGLAERDLVEDYGYVSAMAKEAGAKIIEVNYSCPNLGGSKEGALFSDPENSALVSKKIRESIGDTPLMIKLGWMPAEQLEKVIAANRPYVDGFAAINTIPRKIVNDQGGSALPGEGRLQSGTCGFAIGELAEEVTSNLIDLRTKWKDDFVICSVGGMMTAQDLHRRLEMGADMVMSATAAMWDPYLAQRFHEYK